MAVTYKVKKRKLRARYVTEGTNCRECGRKFFPQKTISGRSTEGLCGGECGWKAFQRREQFVVGR